MTQMSRADYRAAIEHVERALAHLDAAQDRAFDDGLTAPLISVMGVLDDWLDAAIELRQRAPVV